MGFIPHSADVTVELCFSFFTSIRAALHFFRYRSVKNGRKLIGVDFGSFIGPSIIKCTKLVLDRSNIHVSSGRSETKTNYEIHRNVTKKITHFVCINWNLTYTYGTLRIGSCIKNCLTRKNHKVNLLETVKCGLGIVVLLKCV